MPLCVISNPRVPVPLQYVANINVVACVKAKTDAILDFVAVDVDPLRSDVPYTFIVLPLVDDNTKR